MLGKVIDKAVEIEYLDGSLRVRPWQTMDAEPLFDAVRTSLNSVGRRLPWCHAGYALIDAQAWIKRCQENRANGDAYAFGIFDDITGEVVGSVGLNQRNRVHRSAQMGYWIRESRQGQGLAVRAARLAARFGFEQLELIRIEIVTLVDNRASRRTAEKLGAHFESLARHRLWQKERALDAAVYSLIPSDIDQPAAAQNCAMSS